MAVFTRGGPLTETFRKFKPHEKRKLEDLIKGLKFQALHLNYSRTFIISGLSKDSIGSTFFSQDMPDGRKQNISVFDYFKATYPQFCQRIPLNRNWPAVQVGSSRNAKYFPIEACELLRDEVYRRKLNPVLQGMVTRQSSQQVSI